MTKTAKEKTVKTGARPVQDASGSAELHKTKPRGAKTKNKSKKKTKSKKGKNLHEEDLPIPEKSSATVLSHESDGGDIRQPNEEYANRPSRPTARLEEMMEEATKRLAKMDEMEKHIMRLEAKIEMIQMSEGVDLEKQDSRKKQKSTDMTPLRSVTINKGMARSGDDKTESSPSNEVTNKYDKDAADEDNCEVRTNAADFTDSTNAFKFPINVDPFTRTAELLAVLITVYTQNNIFQGVDLFVQSFKYIGQTPGVTIWKYYIAAITQVLVGLYGVFVTFIIIMQAQEVVELLLNFTAMEFVAALDDAAFELSLRGFVGHPMTKTAKIVRDVQYRPRDKRKWLRKWPLFMVLVAVMAWYIIVRVDQDNRKFGDNEIYIQLKDEVIPWLSTLSGTYIGCTMSSSMEAQLKHDTKVTIGSIFYSKLPVDKCRDENNWKGEHAMFIFCDVESVEDRWVFVVGEDKFDPCNKWSMRSYKPEAEVKNIDEYDILAHSTVDWFAKDPQNISSTGVLESIQFVEDSRTSTFDVDCGALAPTGSVFLAPFYPRIDGVKIRDRPVYFGSTSDGEEFIMFNGIRWITVPRSGMVDCAADCTVPDTNDCIPICMQKFDPYLSNYTVVWISDRMDLRTKSDTGIPTTGLKWNKAKSNVTGNAAEPEVDTRSFLEKTIEYPRISDSGSLKNATEKQINDAKSLFLESARLSCACKEGTDNGCEGISSCSNGGTRIWIDLRTDDYPYETCIAIKTKEASDAEFYTDSCATSPDLQQIGTYDWGARTLSPVSQQVVYSYRSCLPPGECGLVYWQDSFGDGMSPPGSFGVSVNGLTLPNEYEFAEFRPTSCVYQFGDSQTCENSIKCYVNASAPSSLDGSVRDQGGIIQVYPSA
ncbi:MAG: hypothetical protein SGBAC_011243 [Bacillariaceae sp.]